jgi:hypothetical protein
MGMSAEVERTVDEIVAACAWYVRRMRPQSPS